MKKIFALVLAAMLCLSTCAMAETFTFTAADYAESFSFIGSAAMGWQVNWTDFAVVEEDPSLEVAFATGEGFTEVQVVGDVKTGACQTLASSIAVNFAAPEAGTVAQHFGATVMAIPLAAAYLELDGDNNALVEAIPAYEEACLGMVENAFSAAALETLEKEGTYVEEGVIGGHPAQLILTMGGSINDVAIDFIYMP